LPALLACSRALNAYSLLAVLTCCANYEHSASISIAQDPVVRAKSVAADPWPSVVWLEGGCTGFLAHEDLVVTAGHCGVRHAWALFGPRVDGRITSSGSMSVEVPPEATVVGIRRCTVHERAGVGSPVDIAFCELREPVFDVPPLRPAVGCEREGLETGAELTVVGYGLRDAAAREFGTKHASVAKLVARTDELHVGDRSAGTCYADSGGPALLRLDLETGTQWRAVGVLSSGELGECGLGYYTDLATVEDWLEAKSQRDLTPCFSARGSWRPTADCRSDGLAEDGHVVHGQAGRLLETCGKPFKPGRPDERPPTVGVKSAAVANGVLAVEVDANDAAGWGVRGVRLTVRDKLGNAICSTSDEFAPYKLSVPVQGSVADFTITATDFAGKAITVVSRLPQGVARKTGCSLVPGGSSDRSVGWLLCLWGAMLLFRGGMSRFTPAAKARCAFAARTSGPQLPGAPSRTQHRPTSGWRPWRHSRLLAQTTPAWSSH
jgi:hypothetical protein